MKFADIKDMKYFFLFMPLLISCASDSTYREERKSAEYNAAVRTAENNLVSLDCSSRPVTDPKTRMTLLAKKCGLLFDELLTKDQLKKEICPALGLNGKSCAEQVKTTFFARLSERYPGADQEKLEKQCNVDPVSCKSLRDMEARLAEMHNARVFERLTSKLDSIFEKDRIEREEESQRVSDAIGRAFSGANSSLNGNRCPGFKPMASMGCKVVCISGNWEQVCN